MPSKMVSRVSVQFSGSSARDRVKNSLKKTKRHVGGVPVDRVQKTSDRKTSGIPCRLPTTVQINKQSVTRRASSGGGGVVQDGGKIKEGKQPTLTLKSAYFV